MPRTRYPPLRLLLGSYAIDSIRDRLRSVIEEIEDWKHLHFPTPEEEGKGKGKAKRGEGTEILNNAKLRLKPGQRYALLGRNGTGKSSKPGDPPTVKTPYLIGLCGINHVPQLSSRQSPRSSSPEYQRKRALRSYSRLMPTMSAPTRFHKSPRLLPSETWDAVF